MVQVSIIWPAKVIRSNDCGAESGSVKVFGQPENGSLEAIADLLS